MNIDQVQPDAGILSLLLALKDQPGWRLYIKRLDEAVTVNLNVLKTYPTGDFRYLQGEIAGMEAARRILDEMIDEIRAAGNIRMHEDMLKMQRDYVENSETPYG